MRIEPIKLIGGIYWIGKWQPDDTVELGDGYHREGMDILGFAYLKVRLKMSVGMYINVNLNYLNIQLSKDSTEDQ